MSREQWGHGYHKGVADALNAAQSKRWGIMLTDGGDCQCVFRVIKEYPDGVLLVEHWGYFDLMTFANCGYKASDEIDTESVAELTPGERKILYFHTFESMISKWIALEKERDKREHNRNRV